MNETETAFPRRAAPERQKATNIQAHDIEVRQ